MIHEVSGDILLTNAQVIAHGVAPNDSFHQGLALQLREQWPALYKDFRHYCQTQHPKAGETWSWMGASGKRIVNLFTQDAAYEHGSKPGKATTHNVGHALRELHKLALAEHFTSIALPRLATGVGGLAWEEVKPLIEQHLGSLDVPIMVYTTYHAGQKATEPVQG
jgi:O-acetyl-ADP-ribose deacetylase (regulator of RNase III)